MKYVFLDHNEYTAGMVIDILKSENIRYKLETKKIGWGESDYIYNITIDTTPEHILFVIKLVREKLEPYVNAEKNFMLPSYVPKHESGMNVTVAVNGNTPIIALDKLHKSLCNIAGVYDVQIVTPKVEPKKSLLKKLVGWLTNNT
jgi:hypothetical protein